MSRIYCLRSVSDADVLSGTAALAATSRCVEVDLIIHLAEVDRRKLYAEQACSSLFTYCTERLRFSEAAAYLRIRAARASLLYPLILDMLGDAQLHLSGIALLVPHLTSDNHASVLARAAGKSKREIESLVAELAPKPDVPTSLRKLPKRRRAKQPTAQLFPAAAPTEVPARAAAPAISPPTLLQPIAPTRYKLQLTASEALHDKLLRLRALMRHQVADGDFAQLIEIAVTDKIERLEASQLGAVKAPRAKPTADDAKPSSRHIPAAVRRAVRARDDDRCAFVDDQGRRCTEREGLQFHHVIAYGKGGGHHVDNIQQTCRTHNVYFAEQDYGAAMMSRYKCPPRAEEPAVAYGDHGCKPKVGGAGGGGQQRALTGPRPPQPVVPAHTFTRPPEWAQDGRRVMGGPQQSRSPTA